MPASEFVVHIDHRHYVEFEDRVANRLAEALSSVGISVVSSDDARKHHDGRVVSLCYTDADEATARARWASATGRVITVRLTMPEKYATDALALVTDPFPTRPTYRDITASRVASTQQTEPNESPWTAAWRGFVMKRTSTIAGRVLDIGCGDPLSARGFWPAAAAWDGVDPMFAVGEAGIVASEAEFLRGAGDSYDCVAWLGSMDHVLDYRLAFDAGLARCRSGGAVIIAGLAWSPGPSSTLATDSIHWHHFRMSDYFALLLEHGCRIDTVDTMAWKGDKHRRAVIIVGAKP